MAKNYCSGCRNNFYNGHNQYGISQCWSKKTAKVVWRIPIGFWEKPPYKKKKVRIYDCYHESGSNRRVFIEDKSLTRDGYWR